MKKTDPGVFIRTRINTLIKEKDISARTMSELIGCSPNYIYNMNQREHIPSMNVLQSICDHFGITLAEFFTPDFSQYKTASNLLTQLNDNHDEETIALLYDFVVLLDADLKSFLKLYRKGKK